MAASVHDLAVFLRQDVDPAAAAQAVGFADGLVRASVGLPAPDPWPPVLDMVTVRVAARLYANPRGVQSESVGSRQVTFTAESGGTLTGEERALCGLYSARSSVYSVRLTTPADHVVGVEVPTL